MTRNIIIFGLILLIAVSGFFCIHIEDNSSNLGVLFLNGEGEIVDPSSSEFSFISEGVELEKIYFAGLGENTKNASSVELARTVSLKIINVTQDISVATSIDSDFITNFEQIGNIYADRIEDDENAESLYFPSLDDYFHPYIQELSYKSSYQLHDLDKIEILFSVQYIGKIDGVEVNTSEGLKIEAVYSDDYDEIYFISFGHFEPEKEL